MLKVSSQRKDQLCFDRKKIAASVKRKLKKEKKKKKKKLKGVETQVLVGVSSLAYHDYSQA